MVPDEQYDRIVDEIESGLQQNFPHLRCSVLRDETLPDRLMIGIAPEGFGSSELVTVHLNLSHHRSEHEMARLVNHIGQGIEEALASFAHGGRHEAPHLTIDL